jgi:hypothetical protein
MWAQGVQYCHDFIHAQIGVRILWQALYPAFSGLPSSANIQNLLKLIGKGGGGD